MSDLCVFTTGTNLSLLRQSCDRFGVTLATYEARWSGYLTVKVKLGVQFLETRPEPFAMWVDGDDSLILKPEAEILSRLLACRSQVMIAAERTCWPDTSLADRWPEADGPRFPQAGGFAGPTAAVISAMHTVIDTAKGDEDDTLAWSHAMLDGLLPNVGIDHDRRIFCAESDGAETAGADPCVRHWNGRVPGREEFWRTYAETQCR